MAGNRGFDRLPADHVLAVLLGFGWLGIAALIDFWYRGNRGYRSFGWLGIAALIDLYDTW